MSARNCIFYWQKKWKRAAKKTKGRPRARITSPSDTVIAAMFLRARMTSPSDGSPNRVVQQLTYDVTNVLMLLFLLKRLHYGFEKIIYFCIQQNKIACIIYIIKLI